MIHSLVIRCLILFSFLIIWNALKSQTYHPMPVSDARWDMTRCWSFYPGGWHDEYSIRMDGSDTILYGQVYKKLFLVTHHLPGTQHDSVYTNFLGGMREANKQVFFVSEYLCIDTIERMIYDFNEVNTGDTIYTQILTNGLIQFIPHIVTSIDSVLIGENHHRRIHLRDEDDIHSEYWIDGVGSSLGLTYASYWLLTDNSYDLNCFYTEGILQYTNPAPTYLFCLSPLPEIDCDSLNTSIPPIVENSSFKIFPNPASHIINIESAGNCTAIHIYNGLGERMIVSEFTSQITIASLPPGFYEVQLIGDLHQVIASSKLIKIFR